MVCAVLLLQTLNHFQANPEGLIKAMVYPAFWKTAIWLDPPLRLVAKLPVILSPTPGPPAVLDEGTAMPVLVIPPLVK